MTTDATPPAHWRPLGRLVLGLIVVAYGFASRLFLGPCAGFVGGALLVLPVAAVSSLGALFSLAMAAVAWMRGDCPRVLVELGMACLMLVMCPVSMAANALVTGECLEDDAR